MLGRLINRLVPLILFGAAANVGVCWSTAVFQQPRSAVAPVELSADLAGQLWSEHAPAAWLLSDEPRGEQGASTGRRWRIVSVSLRSVSDGRDQMIKPTDEHGVLVVSHYGWPWPALGSRAIIRTGAQPLISVENGRWIGTQDELLRRHDLRALAWGPIWPGLAANTGMYAGIMLILGWIAAARRRNRRRQRGQCARCGYDLRSGGVHSTCCPECGAQ